MGKKRSKLPDRFHMQATHKPPGMSSRAWAYKCLADARRRARLAPLARADLNKLSTARIYDMVALAQRAAQQQSGLFS